MQKNKTLWYVLLCIVVCTVPVSCDVQKRLYMPGYFVQHKSSLPAISSLPGKNVARSIAENSIGDSSLSRFNSQHLSWLTYISNKALVEKAKNSLRTSIESKQLHTGGTPSEVRNNNGIVSPENTNNNTGKVRSEGTNAATIGKEQTGTIPDPVRNNDYENLILAFLAGAGSVLLLAAARKKYKEYNASNNSDKEAKKNKEEIANMADRLNRCADRFANAKNETVESEARKAAIAISNCNDIGNAKKLEKTFNDTYLSPSQASSMQHLTSNNLLSNDFAYEGGYGGGTLKPDVVTTTGGYYKNSAGSLSWTLGEPISETVSDGTNTLTEGFQQGSYSIVSVDEVDQPTVNISVYPNPVTSLLNIKSDSGAPFRAEVIDLQGNIVSNQSFDNGQGQIDVSTLPEAIYLLEAFDKNGDRIKVFKIQKVD